MVEHAVHPVLAAAKLDVVGAVGLPVSLRVLWHLLLLVAGRVTPFWFRELRRVVGYAVHPVLAAPECHVVVGAVMEPG